MLGHLGWKPCQRAGAEQLRGGSHVEMRGKSAETFVPEGTSLVDLKSRKVRSGWSKDLLRPSIASQKKK